MGAQKARNEDIAEGADAAVNPKLAAVFAQHFTVRSQKFGGTSYAVFNSSAVIRNNDDVRFYAFYRIQLAFVENSFYREGKVDFAL